MCLCCSGSVRNVHPLYTPPYPQNPIKLVQSLLFHLVIVRQQQANAVDFLLVFS
jgi:hypothetical protein